MEAHDSPALLTWNWKLRAGKAMEMSVKRDRQKWAATRDDQAVRCECSCDREELLMVIPFPLTASVCCAKHYLSYSSNAFAAKICNIITVMALL